MVTVFENLPAANLSFLRSCMDTLLYPAWNLGMPLTASFKACCPFVDPHLRKVGREGGEREAGEGWQSSGELTNREQNHITTLDQWTPRHTDKTDGHRQDIRLLLRNKFKKKKSKNPVTQSRYITLRLQEAANGIGITIPKRKNYNTTKNEN